MLKVVCAYIEIENKILIAQRKGGKYDGYFEFPGGKVEKGESEEQAIEREIKEELDMKVKVCNFITNNIYEYKDKTIDLRLYKCDYISGDIKLNVHSDYELVNKKELIKFEFAPADIKLVEYILNN